MGQGEKKAVIKPKIVTQSKIKKITQTQGKHHKQASKKKPLSKSEHQLTAAINKNIESIMSARLIHDGGTLAILEKPENVEEFAKGGIRLSAKAHRDVAQSNAARKRRMDKENKALQGAQTERDILIQRLAKDTGIELTKDDDNMDQALKKRRVEENSITSGKKAKPLAQAHLNPFNHHNDNQNNNHDPDEIIPYSTAHKDFIEEDLDFDNSEPLDEVNKEATDKNNDNDDNNISPLSEPSKNVSSLSKNKKGPEPGTEASEVSAKGENNGKSNNATVNVNSGLGNVHRRSVLKSQLELLKEKMANSESRHSSSKSKKTKQSH